MFTVAYVLGVTPGKWAGIWNERMPRHPLTLSQVSPADAVAALVAGAADVALLRLPLDDQSLSSIPLYVEKPVVVVPKGHVVEALDSVHLAELEGVLEGDWAANVELVAANVGVAVMPQSVARALSRKDVVARPVVDAPETQVALVWLTTTPEVEEFIGIVRGRTANSSRGEPTPKTPKPPRAPRAVTPKKRPRRR
ncbi:MAG: LysR family transcriptional regulator [Actinobacteria bacterium]|nr:LysR family transcriptional regulator [Actinomycetota bacterium]